MLKSLLTEKRAAIVERWRQAIAQSYPADASRLVQPSLDPFRNPVGHAISHGTEALYEALVEELGAERLSEPLEEIVRIRAVQDFTPSQAVGFVFQLKKAVRTELGSQADDDALAGELRAFEARIDELALLAFEIYVNCRERISEIRVNEIKKQSFQLWERFQRARGEGGKPAEEPARNGAAPDPGAREEGKGP